MTLTKIRLASKLKLLLRVTLVILSVLVLSTGVLGGTGIAWAQGTSGSGSQNTQGRDPIVVGGEEPVLVSYEGGESVETLTNMDTGAGYASLDETVARDDLGIDVDNPENTQTVRSSLGTEERPLFPVEVQIAGQTLNVQATIADRSEVSTKMLLGSRDLEGFLIDVSSEQLTQPDSPRVESYVASLLEFPPPPPNPATLLAALPLAAAMVVTFRSLVGLQTFGIFAPILLSVAFVQSGLVAGLLIFGVMIAAGLVAEPLMKPLHLPRVARLAIILGLVAGVLLGAGALIDDPSVSSNWTSAFPVVITAFIVERFWESWEQDGLGEALKTAGLTLLIALIATPILVAYPVRFAGDRAPVVLALGGAILALIIGRYRGLRLTELKRFRAAAGEKQS